MWNEMKQQHLNELQRRESENLLTVDEEHALEKLLSELEQEEWQMLNPALERERQEQSELQTKISRTETQNAILSAIASRQEDLAKWAKTQLQSLRNEHEALKTECERVLHELAA
ncbi:hypothetical protein BH20ACI1_BH20ACI1_31160 [soil metagenome]